MTKRFNARTKLLLCCLMALFAGALLCAQFVAPVRAETDEHDHVYTDWNAAITPNCTTEGKYAYRSCYVCEIYQYIEDLTVTDYDEYVAAEDHPALKTCDSSEFYAKIMLSLRHDWSTIVQYKAATCLEEGNYSYRKCTECGWIEYTTTTDVIADDYFDTSTDGIYNTTSDNILKIAKLSHFWENVAAAKNPSCTEKGNCEYAKCNRGCNQYRYRKANGSDWEYCSATEDAYNEYISIMMTKHFFATSCQKRCSNCTYERDESELEHKFDTAGNAAHYNNNTEQHAYFCQNASCADGILYEDHIFATSCQKQCSKCPYERADSELIHSYTILTFDKIDGTQYHWYECDRAGCESEDIANKVACVIKYEKEDMASHVSYCEIDGNRHELGENGEQLKSNHNWASTFMQDLYDNGEGSYHDRYCEECDTWLGSEISCNINSSSNATNHWGECSICKHVFPSEPHDFQMVYDYIDHWMECSVCGSLKDDYDRHTFESATSTSCSEEGCGYQRFLKLNVEIDGYEIGAPLSGLSFSATTDRTDANPSSIGYKLYDSNFDLIPDYEVARNSFCFNTLYYVVLYFDCGNVYPSNDMIAADVYLPEDFECGFRDLNYDQHEDGTEYVEMSLLVVLPPVAGSDAEDTISEIEIDFKNFEVGNVGYDVEIDITGKGASADEYDIASFYASDFMDAEGYWFFFDDEYIIRSVYYVGTLTIWAPFGCNFYGLTESNITIKNGMGIAYMVSAEEGPEPTSLRAVSASSESLVSKDGQVLKIIIVLNGLVPEHVCGEDGWEIYPSFLGISPDITTQHLRVCSTCGAVEFVDHVYESDLDTYCDDCGYDDRELKLDEMHFTLTGYQADARLCDITATYSGKYAKAVENQWAVIVDPVTYEEYDEGAICVPGKAYGLLIEFNYPGAIDISDCLFDNVYVNGTKVKVVWVEGYDGYVFYELQLPAVPGESEQKKVSGVNLNASGFVLGSCMKDVSLELDENPGIKHFSVSTLVDGDEMEREGTFEYGKTYEINVVYELKDGYYGMGVTADDLKVSHFEIGSDSQKIDLGNFECFGISVDDLAYGDVGRLIFCRYFVVIYVPEDAVEGHNEGHIFPTEYPTYYIDENKHYVCCGCGAHDEGEEHVYDDDKPYCCTVCGYARTYSVEKMEFEIDWRVGNSTWCMQNEMQFFIDDIEVSINRTTGGTKWLLAFDSLSVYEGTKTIKDVMSSYGYDDIILANRSYTLCIRFMYSAFFIDCSALTKNEYILKGIGETPITAAKMFKQSNEYAIETILVFYIPAIETKHIHGGTWIDEVPATCTNAGTKGHYVCALCGDNFDAENKKLDDITIPAGHRFGAWIPEVPATCTNAGTKGHYVCALCGDNFDAENKKLDNITIPAAHKFGAWIPEVPATMEKTGTVAHKDCDYCHRHFDINGNVIAEDDYVIAKINGYKLIFKIDGEEIANRYLAQGSAITYPESGSKQGFTFAWSQTIETMPNSDVTIEGVFSIDVNYFKSKVDAVQNATTVEDIYGAIVSAKTALALYDGMDTQSIDGEITRLNTLVNQYEQMAQAAENDVKNAVNVVSVMFGMLVQMAIVALATVIVKRRLF